VVSVHTELTFGHLRYYFGDVPPQSNSPPGNVFDVKCIEAFDVAIYVLIHHITIHTTLSSPERNKNIDRTCDIDEIKN
jgi:hypothetical protein